MITRSICLSIFLSIGVIGSAAEPIPPRVPGFDRFYAAPLPAPNDETEETVKLDPVTGGRILLSELNCTSCHATDSGDRVQIVAKQAPILDNVGSRVKIDWIREFLANPHQVKPGTTMPDLIATLPASERADTVTALAHLLASTGTVFDGRPDAVAAAKGAELIRKVGCLACHDSVEPGSRGLATSVRWPELAKKYSAITLIDFLRDPLKSRPSGRMPLVALTDDELRNIANFFVNDTQAPPNINYVAYHGNWTSLPKFSELTPVAAGVTSGFDLNVAGRRTQVGIRFTSHLRILKAGEYRFWLSSDDGSKFLIGDDVIVDCDGLHSKEPVLGRLNLSAGFHQIAVEYFNRTGEAWIKLEMSGPGVALQPVVGMCYAQPTSASGSAEFAVDKLLAEKGRAVFASLGCAACHQMKVNEQTIASSLKVASLTAAKVDAGCLANPVSGKAPRYGLSEPQRQSLNAVLSIKTPESLAESVHRTLASLNCYACHVRDRLGGAEVNRNSSFLSLQNDMGDEGRLPPALTGVGDKLRPDWLRRSLVNGIDDRKNYLVTRMPRFGYRNVEFLVDQFAEADKQPDAMPKVEFTEPDYRVKAAGRHLVGGHALSCIKCHDFGIHPSTGVRAINLTTMTQRLRPDWYYRYMQDPQIYRRGTRMPAPWPFGKTTVHDVLDGNVNQQMQAVWNYLSDRDKAAIPFGLIRESIPLKPSSEPIIYRNFIEGAGVRAIGVGYPERINLAFDANNLRLAMIWHGEFIDASRHWTGRGQGFESPLGDDVIALADHAPIVTLDEVPQQVMRDSNQIGSSRFLGYQLDPQLRPIFHYSIDGTTVEDHLNPEVLPERSPTLIRTMRFSNSTERIRRWFKAASGDKIQEIAPGKFQVNGAWTIEIRSSQNLPSDTASKPIQRTVDGKQELLVPIEMNKGQANLTLRYLW